MTRRGKIGGHAPIPDLRGDHWSDEAACKGTDTEAFFPEKGGSVRDAKRVCGGCAVKAACLEYALENGERFGVWGGLSEPERRKLKRKAGGTAIR